MRCLLWAAVGALAEDWYIHHRNTFAAIQALPELRKLHAPPPDSSALLQTIAQQNATMQALNIRLAENKDREIRTMSKEISEQNQLEKVREQFAELKEKLDSAKEEAAEWRRKATAPTEAPEQSLLQSDSPLATKLKKALLQKTEAFEDMQDKANEYKAKLTSDEQELANWRRKAQDVEEEISRVRGVSEQDKDASKQLTAELQSAQAEAAASAANASAVGQALEQARAQMQKEEVQIKQVLLQRQNTEDSMER